MMADEIKPRPSWDGIVCIVAMARDWWRLSGDHDDHCMLRSSETDVPHVPEQREALSAKQVRALAIEAGFYYNTPPTEEAAFIAGFRHAEAAHGIDAKDGNT